jgi:hypothetical protein
MNTNHRAKSIRSDGTTRPDRARSAADDRRFGCRLGCRDRGALDRDGAAMSGVDLTSAVRHGRSTPLTTTACTNHGKGWFS